MSSVSATARIISTFVIREKTIDWEKILHAKS